MIKAGLLLSKTARGLLLSKNLGEVFGIMEKEVFGDHEKFLLPPRFLLLSNEEFVEVNGIFRLCSSGDRIVGYLQRRSRSKATELVETWFPLHRSEKAERFLSFHFFFVCDCSA